MFNKLTIKAKLLLSFSFVAIIAAIIGYVGYTGMNQIHTSLNNISKNTLPSINSLWIVSEAQTALKAQEFGIGNDKMSSNVKDIEVFINRADKTWINIANGLKIYEPLPQGDQEAVFWKDFLPKWKIWESDDKKVLELAKQKRDILAKNNNDIQAINKINSEIDEAVKVSRSHFGAAEDALVKVLDENIKISEKNAKEAEDASAKSTQLLIIFIVVGVIFAIVLGYFIAISIKKITDAILKEINTIVSSVINGNLSVRGKSEEINFEFRDIMINTNNLIDAFVKPINVTAEYVDRISKGDLPPKIVDEYKGDFNEIKTNLNLAIDSIQALIDDAAMLVKAAVAGKLSTRADVKRHQGDFREIVQGVNDTLDAVIGPLNVAAEYVDRISKGDMPPIIVDNYNGDFNEIKTNLNQAIVAINALVADASLLAQAGVEGKLQTRADASKHQGDFRKIVDGVNNTLDSVIGPLNAANEVLAEMAGGNLAVSIDENYNGDLDTLKQSINNLAFSLRDMIKQISDGVETTATTSYQMSTNADSLASASQEQAAQADEVASAVEEMSRTVTENAMSAGRTAEVAQKNGEIAKEGGSVVEQTITKMRDIATVVMNSAKNIQKLGESSKEIGEIVSVIDDIADQTNLLALNAAIEAARAGEQGRGFAVVADEVRKLAERTTAATKQIASMIKGIQQETEGAVIAMNQGSQEVQNGISLADRAGDSLSEVVSSSQEVLDMINQIVVASEEQSATSEQISKNVMSISKVTGESTERIEQIAHASEDLTRLTESLKEIVSQFRIDDASNKSLITNRKNVSANRNGKQLVSGR